MTAEEARKQQRAIQQHNGNVDEMVAAVRKHIMDGKPDEFIWWYKPVNAAQKQKLEKAGYTVANVRSGPNEYDWKIGWGEKV